MFLPADPSHETKRWERSRPTWSLNGWDEKRIDGTFDLRHDSEINKLDEVFRSHPIQESLQKAGERVKCKLEFSQVQNTMDEKNRLKVVILLKAPEAKEVFLLGDFNNWDPQTAPLKKDGHGLWKMSMLLAPGRYEYKLLVDGQWRLDANNPNRALNALGTENNVLVIPEK